MISLMLVTAFVAGSLAAPVDGPVRVDLPVYEQEKTTNVELAQPIELENYPVLKKNVDNSIVDNVINNKLQIVSNVLGNDRSSTIPPIGAVHTSSGLFAAPVTTLEGALLETEGWASKTLSVKENVQGAVAALFQPKPIVDTIDEVEKYGNNGDKFYSAGRAIVGGAKGVSDFFNSVLEVPAKIIRTVTRTATEKLNNLGAKIVGL